jgi:uncharacterized protein YukE
MSRYCVSCGKLLADDAKFCTSCGAPVEQKAVGNGQPAFEQTGSLDTPQAKPDDPLAYRPDPAAAPAAVETTQRMPVTGTPPQQQPASTYAPDSPQAPAAKKSGTKVLIAVIVVLVAIIIALVIFFVIKPFDSTATQTTAEVTKLHHDVDADDLKPLDDPNSLYDDDDDDDDGEATLSEQNLYRRLSEYYDLLEDLDSQVRACAQAFNGSYLEEDRTTRQNLADVAERTEDTIEQYYDIVEDLDVPMSSKNYSSWKDIVALYDDLDNRIDAICDAWEISLKYAKPADHKDEIVAPLAGDNEPGTNSNKYRQDFEDRYPGAKPVEVK